MSLSHTDVEAIKKNTHMCEISAEILSFLRRFHACAFIARVVKAKNG